MEDIFKIVRSLKGCGHYSKKLVKQLKTKQKNEKDDFYSMLLSTLGASLLGNKLAGKGVVRSGEGTVRVGYGSKKSSIKKIFDSTTSFKKL